MTTFGNDTSRYQKDLKVKQLTALGAEFLMAQCTYGVDGVDPEYPRFRKEAEAEKILFSAYHFIHDVSISGQVKNILANIGDKNIPVMLDLEPSTKGGSPHLRQARLIRRALSGEGISVKALYYPHWYWVSTGEPSLKGWNLVSSAYPSKARRTPKDLYLGDNDSHWTAYGGKMPVIWQYADTGTIPGYTANTVDCDAYRGSRSQLVSEGLFLDYANPLPAPAKQKPTTTKTKKHHIHAEAIIKEAQAGIDSRKTGSAEELKFRSIIALATDITKM